MAAVPIDLQIAAAPKEYGETLLAGRVHAIDAIAHLQKLRGAPLALLTALISITSSWPAKYAL